MTPIAISSLPQKHRRDVGIRRPDAVRCSARSSVPTSRRAAPGSGTRTAQRAAPSGGAAVLSPRRRDAHVVHGRVPEAEQVVGELLGGARLVEHRLRAGPVSRTPDSATSGRSCGNALQRGDTGRVELQHDDAGERLGERRGDRPVDLVVVGALDDGDHHGVPVGARRLLDAADRLGVAVPRGVSGDDGDDLRLARGEHSGRRARAEDAAPRSPPRRARASPG